MTFKEILDQLSKEGTTKYRLCKTAGLKHFTIYTLEHGGGCSEQTRQRLREVGIKSIYNDGVWEYELQTHETKTQM